MKSTHSQPRLDCSIETGWTIHIYNRQRQLLCTLDPSHGWAVATGMVIGLLLAVVGFNLSTPQISNSPDNESAPVTAPLQLD